MAAPTPDLPELIDLDYGDFADDLDFYHNLARRTDGPVLELGCGTGRAAIPLAGAGFDVWAIDTSDAMLERARCKTDPAIAQRLHLERADMRDCDLGRRFDLVFAGYGAFHHLITPDDQLACLRCVARHLATDGRFVCDLRPPFSADWQTGASVPLLHDWTKTLPSGENVTKLRAVRADPATQVQHEEYLYDTVAADGTLRRVVHEVDLRFTTRYEMEALLREAGLELEQTYGDYDLSPYNEASELLIVVARRTNKD